MSASKRPPNYQQFLKALRLTPEQAGQAFRQAGVPLSEDILNGQRNLSVEEWERLEPLAVRFFVPEARPARQRADASPDIEAATPAAPKAPPPVTPPDVQAPPPAAPENREERRPEPDFPPPVTEMDKIAAENVVMIDTCSLMHSMCGKMLRNFTPSLKKYGKKIILPQRVFLELKKHERNSWDEERAMSARNGLALCQELLNAGCLKKMGSDVDNFADNLFFVHFSNYRTLYRMLLITQDYNLTRDILQLNEMGSNKGYPVRVMRITGGGELAESRL